jgi:hypothetical protein
MLKPTASCRICLAPYAVPTKAAKDRNEWKGSVAVAADVTGAIYVCAGCARSIASAWAEEVRQRTSVPPRCKT